MCSSLWLKLLLLSFLPLSMMILIISAPLLLLDGWQTSSFIESSIERLFYCRLNNARQIVCEIDKYFRKITLRKPKHLSMGTFFYIATDSRFKICARSDRPPALLGTPSSIFRTPSKEAGWASDYLRTSHFRFFAKIFFSRFLRNEASIRTSAIQ